MEGLCGKNSLVVWCVILKGDLTAWWRWLFEYQQWQDDIDRHLNPHIIIAKCYRREIGRSLKPTSLAHILASIIISRFVSKFSFLTSRPYTNWTAFVFTHLFKATCLIEKSQTWCYWKTGCCSSCNAAQPECLSVWRTSILRAFWVNFVLSQLTVRYRGGRVCWGEGNRCDMSGWDVDV